MNLDVAVNLDVAAQIRVKWTPERLVSIARATEVGELVTVLRYHEAWSAAGLAARERFAERVLFQRWLIRQGRVGDVGGLR